MLSSTICLVSCLIAWSILLLVVVAISLPFFYYHTAVIAAIKFASSDTWIFTEYSSQSPWIKSWIKKVAEKLSSESTYSFNCLNLLT